MDKVLVTGSEGFIGSHLVERLLRDGYKVRAFVLYNSLNNCGWIEPLKNRVEIVFGDVRDSNNVNQAMKGMDTVFHLAALISIPYSYQSVESYINTNILGTFNVLQNAVYNKVRRILITSTSEVYGTALHTPMNEDHPLQAQSPYAATKISADALAESYFRSFGCPVTIVRPFNTYGPRQSARAVIPTIITQLLSGKKEIKLGNIYSTRDLVFVKDTVNGFIEIAKSHKIIGCKINIATGNEISMGDLAGKLIKMINPNAKIVLDSQRIRPMNSEVDRLVGDNLKLKCITDWRLEYTLDEGLKETVKWFRKNHRLYNSNTYNK